MSTAVSVTPHAGIAVFKARNPYLLIRPDECFTIQFHDGEFRTEDRAQVRFLLAQCQVEAGRGGHPSLECTHLPPQFDDSVAERPAKTARKRG